MADVRTTRLRNDQQRLERLVQANPGRLEIVYQTGPPPDLYEIRFRVRGIVRLHGRSPKYGDEHRAIIAFPPHYPGAGVSPLVRFVTPLVHPHVFESGEVCTGYARSVSEFLDLFVVRLYNLIRWDPSLMNPHSPADHGALLLWESGSIRCPLDEPLVLTSDDRTPAPAMEWTDL